MSLAITVVQFGTQNNVNLQLDLGDTAGQVRDEEHRQTTAAALGFINETARLDEDLSEDQSQTIRLSRTSSDEGREYTDAEDVGKRIVSMTNELMARYHKDPKIRGTAWKIASSIQNAFQHFCEVVKQVFECDENGVARNINLGRIAGVFTYCYYLCKVFIQRHGLEGIFGFMGVLLGYLVRFLLRARFYDWLSRIGGWGQLLTMTDWLIPKLSGTMQSLVLGGAVVLFAVWVYNYWRS